MSKGGFQRMSLAEYRQKVLGHVPPVQAALSAVAKGGSWRSAVAKPTNVRGIRFPSKIQAEVYQLLVAQAGVVVIRDPIFDIDALGKDGRPGRWRPDFLVINTKTSTVEIHETKGTKGAESRDWRLRARAFLNQYPDLAPESYVWRRVSGSPKRNHLSLEL